MSARKKNDSLDAYRKKRDFGRTTEPAPSPARREESERATGVDRGRFVIHRHEARNLHYDLRLEMDGVLKSWAVPRGFSWDPADKHLAVQTEDHPIEYLDFDGVIPKGEYGAGTMVIWDVGTFVEIQGDGLAALEAGELKLELDGARLRGQWHVVRTRGEKDWLLFKTRDRYVRAPGEGAFPIDLTREARSDFPAKVRAMRATTADAPLDDPELLYELDFAGQRLLAFVRDGDEVSFHDADGRAFRPALEELSEELRGLRARDAILDGVLVATDDTDRPDAKELARRLKAGDTAGLVYYAFDLLRYDDWDLRAQPLLRRKEALADVLPDSKRLLYVDHVAGRGRDLLAVVEAGALPGIVAKAASSPYEAGESESWRRIGAGKPGKKTAGSVHDALGGARRKGRVKFSNLEKIYWPKEEITKGQLLDYYDAVADRILPYLRDRPCHMLRYPDGIEGKFFYQKNVVGRVPDWVPTQLIKMEGGEEIRYVVCNDRDTLLYLVNLGSIDLHPWLSRCDDPETPDVAVIDLDPSTDDFGPVIRIAQTVGKILRGAGLRPYLKTSGKTGLHIYLPLERRYSYEQVRMFCEAVARMTVQEHRDIATVERNVQRRDTRLYVDFGQNRREQTLVPPYVVRPVAGATVSTPLDWDELRSGLHPSQFDLFNVPERLELRGDLFLGVVNDPQGLEDAIEALSRRG
ncbi:MAG: non-homologous end-joining DNA ligase [bacterium]